MASRRHLPMAVRSRSGAPLRNKSRRSTTPRSRTAAPRSRMRQAYGTATWGGSIWLKSADVHRRARAGRAVARGAPGRGGGAQVGKAAEARMPARDQQEGAGPNQRDRREVLHRVVARAAPEHVRRGGERAAWGGLRSWDGWSGEALGVRRAEFGHAIQRAGGDYRLNALRLQAARPQRATQHALEARKRSTRPSCAGRSRWRAPKPPCLRGRRAARGARAP